MEGSGGEWRGVEGSGREWRGVEGSGGEWRGVEGSGGEWRGVEGSGGEWRMRERVEGVDTSIGNGGEMETVTKEELLRLKISQPRLTPTVRRNLSKPN